MSPLIVKQRTSAPQKDDYGNLSYFCEFEGIDGGVLVKHKGDKPVLNSGDDAAAHGFDRVDEIRKKTGTGTYKKLMRPDKGNFNSGGGRSNPEDMRQRAAQGALANAVAFSNYLQSIDKPAPTNSKDLLRLADVLYQWIRDRSEGK